MNNKIFHIETSHGPYTTHLEQPQRIFFQTKQVHGTDFFEITPETPHFSPDELPSADALYFFYESFVSKKNSQSPPEYPSLAIKTADCMPILFIGKNGVALIHAGWRGLKENILTHSVVHQLAPTSVTIGPSIDHCCYEVGEDFIQHFHQSAHFVKRNEKIFFHLKNEAQSQILKVFPKISINISPLCTHCHPHLHSYRQNQTQKRNWNLYSFNNAKE